MMAWYIDGSVSMGNLDVIDVAGRICMIECDDDYRSDEEVMAAAYMIKAAPDMLAALGALVWQLDRMDDLPEELEIMVVEAKAAIAQTKGEA